MIDFGGVLVGAIIALLGSIWVSYINSRNQTYLAKQSQQEARRTQRHEYMIGLMRDLVEAKIEYEKFLAAYGGINDAVLEADLNLQASHGATVGKAIAVCLATGIPALQEIAEGSNGLTPYMVPNYKDRNRNGLHTSLKTLGSEISRLSGTETNSKIEI
jgi:hypothetical protein